MADPTVLRADCESCFGLCCVATTLTRSADFAFDKPAGEPCRHLDPGPVQGPAGFGCTVHADLRERGMPGCTTYDCFGAGQRVAQQTYRGVSWRQAPGTAGQMFRVFGAVRGVHELLWLLTEALGLATSAQLQDGLAAALGRLERLAGAPAPELDGLDVDAERAEVLPLLRRAGELARGAGGRPGADLGGADLLGRDLRDVDLRAASLRGALLVGADLRGVDLRLADLTGADLRGADLRGCDLSTVLFLSSAQVHAARGDDGTRLPSGLDRPGHWRTGPGPDGP